jgi:[acyl-carrier-protein] S-malonyltransferase
MLAFLFPGQGSQAVGMGKALAERDAAARRTFDEADAALGYSISRLCFEGPAEELTLTANAQPAILACSIAALRCLEQETGLRPAVVAGHSLGEYSALVAAGALGFADAVRVVHLRGRYMQEAVPAGQGAMAALLGPSAEQAAALCEAAAEGEVLSPANFNGGGQIVIAGHAGAVQRAVARAKEHGAKRAIPLQVSAPFHCALMAPAAARLAETLRDIRFVDAAVPVVTNVGAEPNQEGERARALLVQQVTAPVRWEESVLCLARLGVRRALEIGPGKVLAGLVKRITKEIEVANVEGPDDVAALAKAPS